ncbi:MAG: hypothetical protein IJP90_01010 [Treponema sp.]|nr:hypothetical protein [Treponema sp.]MBR0098282.1 hypothetical protein [Treponema sp.]
MKTKNMEIQLMPNEPPTQVAKESQMSFDVSVKFNDGERAEYIDILTKSEGLKKALLVVRSKTLSPMRKIFFKKVTRLRKLLVAVLSH